jgi:hypothetical protein
MTRGWQISRLPGRYPIPGEVVGGQTHYLYIGQEARPTYGRGGNSYFVSKIGRHVGNKEDAEQLRSIKVTLNNWGQTNDWRLRGGVSAKLSGRWIKRWRWAIQVKWGDAEQLGSNREIDTGSWGVSEMFRQMSTSNTSSRQWLLQQLGPYWAS